MKPSKAENIARNICRVCLLLLILACWATVYFVRQFGQPMVLPFLGVTAVCYFATMGAAIAVKKLSKTRLALAREEGKRRRIAAIGLPDFSKVDTSKAIVSLFWTIDYHANRRRNYTYSLYSWGTWIRPSIMGFFILVACYCIFDVRNAGVLIGSFVAGSLVFLVLGQLVITTSLRKVFPKEAAVQNVALVLDSNAMHYIVGQEVVELTWDTLKSIREIRGLVFTVRTDGARMIPEYAFHSREDARAFVGTAKALKKGEIAPAYDWSAYQPEVPVAEGVWPPAIS